MNREPIDTPVVLCVYNRPRLTKQLVTAIATAAPSHILVIGDGPKTDNPRDRADCAEVIRILEEIPWKARIEWNVSAANMGCRRRIQTGLSWAFDRVEEAIVLEDDCLPHPSFFPFCTTLLDRFRDDSRVALISGCNFQFDADCGPASYFFSRYPLVWGWAGWRRSWQPYDPDITAWESLRETSWLSDLLADPLTANYWYRIFDKVRAGFDTWDFSMTFACWLAGALSVQPRRNLMRNVGFNSTATHTRDGTSNFANMPVHEMPFPLVHPDEVARAVACDERTERLAFSGTVRQRLLAARNFYAAKSR